MVFFHFLLVLVALTLLLLSGVLLAEVLLGLRRTSPTIAADITRPTVAVVVPAHNEETVLGVTLENLGTQIKDGDRLIVVADNCTDDTAGIARAVGAIVLERTNVTERGKGYALQYALDHLKDAPPDIVIFVDADCQCAPETLDKISMTACSVRRAAQALYVMEAAIDGGPKSSISAFAWRFMNETRMWGLQQLGGITRVTGAGFAVPWEIAKTLSLGSGEIVEDLALTMALAEKQQAPVLVGDALITSQFPNEERAASIQHARWEHGSLRMAMMKAVPLFIRGLTTGNKQALWLGLDIAIPPLTLFAMSLAVIGSISLLFALFGFGDAFGIMLLASFIFTVSVVVGWWRDGQAVLPPEQLRDIPDYILSKTKVYNKDARQSTKTWTRTERDSE